MSTLQSETQCNAQPIIICLNTNARSRTQCTAHQHVVHRPFAKHLQLDLSPHRHFGELPHDNESAKPCKGWPGERSFQMWLCCTFCSLNRCDEANGSLFPNWLFLEGFQISRNECSATTACARCQERSPTRKCDFYDANLCLITCLSAHQCMQWSAGQLQCNRVAQLSRAPITSKCKKVVLET